MWACYLLSFALFVCEVHSQLCSPPILPPLCPAPCMPIPCPPAIPPCPPAYPQVINPNPYVTTIIDNSVSNALINALQLLIVSNLIGATIGPSAPMVNNLGPLLDSIVCQNPFPIDVIVPEYINCGPSYDMPYGPIPICAPCYDIMPPCGPITTYNNYEVIPSCGPITTYNNYEVIPSCGPITTYNNYELIPPCGPIFDPYPPLCGLSDAYPYCTYTETISPICFDSLPYNGYNDLLPAPGMETFCPNFCGGLPDIIPTCINYPIPEGPVNLYCGGFAETVSPTIAALPMFGCLNEAPCLPPFGNLYPDFGLVAPGYCSGLELPVPDVVFPPACNYGYSPPSLPWVNMEPVPFDNCIFNGFGNPVYY